MRVIKTHIPDLIIFEPTVFADTRGYFMEFYNQRTFGEAGIGCTFVQDNESSSGYGVIRGLHYQLEPYSQVKLLRVVHGKILDVALDIRRGSPTFGQHLAIELSGENKRMLLIPRGFAHGFSVLSANAVVQYKCDSLYNREAERGVKYDDPSLGIDWQVPTEKRIVSPKDMMHPALAAADINFDYTRHEQHHG